MVEHQIVLQYVEGYLILLKTLVFHYWLTKSKEFELNFIDFT